MKFAPRSNRILAPGLHAPSARLAALALVAVLAGSAAAQVCSLSVDSSGGGTIDASGGSSFDPQLQVSIAPNLSSVVLENSELRVRFASFPSVGSEYSIADFIIKDVNTDQAGSYLNADAGRGPLSSASIVYEGTDRITVRMEWLRWNIASQSVEPTQKIRHDYTIYPNSRVLRIDYTDIRYGINCVDLGAPGGGGTGIHVAHGHEDWIRPYITHEVGSYYNRYPPDGVNDPANGGSLNYNGNFIIGIYNANNGQGWGRVMPVANTHIIKLLLSSSNRRGLEFFNHPFLQTHPPFTTYMYGVTGGAAEILQVGRDVIDLGVETGGIQCGDTLQLTAVPYSGWDFSSWSGALSGSVNPENLLITGDHTVVANFTPEPALVFEGFDSYAPGANPTGWFDTGANSSLAQDDTLFTVRDVDGERVFGTSSTATNIHSHWVGAGSGSFANFEYTGRMRVDSNASGVGVTFHSQFPASSQYYRLRNFNGGTFHLTRFTGSFTSGTTDTGIVPLPGNWYRFAVRVTDDGLSTTIQAKVWQDGSAEPAGWQAEAVDAAANRLTSGTVGMWSFGAGEKLWDELAVRQVAAPGTAVLGVTTVGNGTVTLDPDQAVYALGQVVTLTAEAAPGWVFTGWSGDLSGTNPVQTLVMDEDRSVTATFLEISQHTLTLLTAGSGTASASPDQPTYDLGQEVMLAAMPSPGWLFGGWSGGFTSGLNPALLTITGDLTVTATFLDALFVESFDSYVAGADPVNWLDTSANNGLAQNDALFQVQDVAGARAFATSSTQTNIHSHYVGTETNGLSGYEYLGRMRMSAADGGIGVTFFSDFASSARYYRLRRYAGNAFHFSPIGTSLTGGTTDTGVVPAPNTWYRFRIQVEDTGARTEMRAKVWPDGGTEPAGWQAEAWDAAAGRLLGGRIGVWSFSSGSKYWDDLQVKSLTPLETVTLSIASVGSGSVSPDPDLASYPLGQVVTLTASPAPGFVFAGWSGDLSGTANPETIAMNADRSVTATFVPAPQHSLSISIAGGGSVDPLPDQPTYPQGTLVELTAVPAAGFVFAGWSGDLSGTANPETIAMDGDRSVTATFVPQQHTLSIAVVGGGDVTADPDLSTYPDGTLVELTAVPAAGFAFTGWSGDLAGTTNPETLTMDGDRSVTATFAAIQHTLSVSLVGNGTVALDPNQASYDEGTVVGLTAVPAVGWIFSGWSGDLSGMANPESIAMDSDHAVTATFVPQQHTVSISIVGMGSVAVDPDVALHDHGATVTLTPTPAAGWSFFGWSGQASGSASPLVLTVTQDLAITATFTTGLLIEGFEGFAAGSDPDGWADTAASNSLAPNPALFQVVDLGGDHALGTTSTSTNIHSHYVGPGAGALADYELSGRMRTSAAQGGVGVTFLSKFPSSAEYYRLRRYGDLPFHLSPLGTQITGGTTSTGVVPQPGVWYRFRLQVEDLGTSTAIRARVWADGGPEPGAWQAEAFDASPTRLTSGTIGAWSFSSGAKYWDDLAVTPLAPQSPAVLTLATTGDGSVQVAPDQMEYTFGQVVTLTAVPDAGWVFSGWGGALAGSDNPETLVMAGDQSVTATFVPVTQHTITLATAGMGSASADPDQALYDLGQTVSLTATPSPGWTFAGWSGDLTSLANPLEVTVTGDFAVQANFVDALVSESFESYAAGANPAGWLDTGAQNSLAANDSLFSVASVGGSQVLSTSSTATNIHSHFVAAPGLADIELTGRMRIEDPKGGVGVTFLSQYPAGTAYYRLRRYFDNAFHLSPFGTQITGGSTDTGVVPLSGVWYLFRIQAEDTGARTEIRARVWREGTPEPATWQAEAWDDSATRRTSGTIGVWSFASGAKRWDDLVARPLATGP